MTSRLTADNSDKDQHNRQPGANFASRNAILAGMAAVACGLIFMALTLAVEGKLVIAADRRTELLVHTDVSQGFYGVMAALTFVGNSGSIAVLAFVCVVFYLRSGEYWAAAFIAACPTGGSILDLVLKGVFHRARPHLWSNATIIHSYSFPSGHASISSAFFAGISYVTWKSYGARSGSPVIAVCALLTAGIGFSRVYLGVHWPSDVLAGFALGLGWTLLLIVVIESRHVHTGSALAQTFKPRRKVPGRVHVQ